MSWYKFADTSMTLDNDGKTPIVYIDACLSGKFDDLDYECYAEYLVQDREGAVAVIAASRTSYYCVGWDLGDPYNQALLYYFAQEIMDENNWNVGLAFYNSRVIYAMNFDMNYYANLKDFLVYILFSDPLLHIWRNPRYIEATYPRTIMIGQRSIKVTVRYSDTGEPVPNATVTIYSIDKDIFITNKTSSNGEAVLELPPLKDVNYLNITISGIDIVPRSDVIKVSRGVTWVNDKLDFGGWGDLHRASIWGVTDYLYIDLEWLSPIPNQSNVPSDISLRYYRDAYIAIDTDFSNETGDSLGRDIELVVTIGPEGIEAMIYEYNESTNSWTFKDYIDIVDYGSREKVVNGVTEVEYLTIAISLSEVGIKPGTPLRIYFIDIYSTIADDYVDYLVSVDIDRVNYSLVVDGNLSDWDITYTTTFIDSKDYIDEESYEELNMTKFYVLWGDKMYYGLELEDSLTISKFLTDSTTSIDFHITTAYDVDMDGSLDFLIRCWNDGIWIRDLRTDEDTWYPVGDYYQIAYSDRYLSLIHI